MTPVLRVVIPTANLTETTRDLGGQAHNFIVRGLNTDYITDDPNENKPVPATALYAARMDARGVITVIRTRQAGITAEHSYAGWPIPA
jgi:ABC-type Fe3+ transport system substrate-binding protein